MRSPRSSKGVGEAIGDAAFELMRDPRPLPSGDFAIEREDNQFTKKMKEEEVNLNMFQNLTLLFSSTALEGPEQMALDEVLLESIDKPLLRLYRWQAPCVTFGYFQKLAMVQALYPDQQLVRRWSGGGCVVHGSDMTFSLIIPASERASSMAPSLFYRRLHEALVTALQQHQMMARLAAVEDMLSGESCFAAPCPCDVMLEGKKIVGGAQRRSVGRLLHQGSLNLGKSELEDEKSKEEFFSSLAARLAPKVSLIEEKQEWLDKAVDLGVTRYRSLDWKDKR